MRALAVLVVAACAHGPVGDLRFHNQPPVWRVNDRTPLAEAPAEREYHRSLYHTDGFVVRRLTRAMDMRPRVRAADVNSLDEVPDSTWFTNRIGVRELSLDEIRRGPNRIPGPFEHLPWSITKSKSGGTAPGFLIEDTSGTKYLLKFDEAGKPEMETAAHVIVHRILWACGFNVPEDYVGYLRREDLVVSPEATKKDEFGNKVKLTEEDIERTLGRVEQEPDGRIRVLVSRYLPGKVIGPYPREGTRPDDPNDVIPHERRRSLRGQFPIFAWLNHTDMQEDNTLDVFDDGHVVHYLVDFGKALGVMGAVMRWQTVGYTYRLDVGIALKTLLSLGLWKRPWDEVESPRLPGIGIIEAEHYDPGEWRPNSLYWPLEDKDRFDAFWGAKLLMRFTPEQLEAIVGEAQYSDPRSAAYMVETLLERQRKTARHWFDRVAPLDRFTVDVSTGTARLCFTDLLLFYGLGNAPTRYELTTFDHDGNATSQPRWFHGRRDGRTCLDGIASSRASDGYRIVRLRVQRHGRTMPEVRVHLATADDGRLTLIGVRRQ
jgi:hypothetical protein